MVDSITRAPRRQYGAETSGTGTNSFLSKIARFCCALLRLNANGHMSEAKADRARRLMACSDAELARLGVPRHRIYEHVFGEDADN